MGVVPIVNENDTVSVSVSAFLSAVRGFCDRLELGNQIRRQRHIICYHLVHVTRRLSVFAN